MDTSSTNNSRNIPSGPAGDQQEPASTPAPFYLLPKDAPPPTEAGGPVGIGGRCDFLITPACVHEAEQTGKFHYMRVSKAALNAEPDSAQSLAHILVSVDELHVKDKKAFQEAIKYGREVLKRNGYALKTQDGRLLDIDRYFQEIEQHADEWLKAAQQQIADHNRTLQTKLGYVKAAHEKTEANASPVLINKLYQNMDGAAQSIIRQSGINYFIDNEETSGLPQLYEKQNAILVPRSYLMEPQATFMLRHTAVARNIDMKQYPNMEQLRLLAMEEIKAKVEKSSKELGRTGRVNALAEVMSAMRGENADKFRKSLPATYLAYHQEEMLLTKKAAELDGRPAMPLPKATDTAFVLNRDVLTKPQQAYFEQLNHIIGMLGVSPDEFDKHFRAQMLQQVALIKLKAKETGMNAAVKEKHGPVPNSVQALYAELYDARSLIGTPEVIAQGDKSAPVRKTTKLKTKKDGFEGLFSKLLDYHFGTGNAGMPEKPLHHEAVLIKTLEQSAARKNSPLSQNENVLQLYASGQRLMPLLKELKSVAEDVSSKIFYPPNLQSYFEASMHNTVAVLADEGAKRQVGGDGTAVRRELQQLEILSKQAFLWPEELDKAREAEAKAREIESQRTLRHLEQVRLEEDKKRKEARIPAAIAVSGIVVDRIFRESGKAHGRNTAERNDDIARMGTLKSRLQELAAPDAMNAKFPPHAELAGALFNDEVMRALEYTHLLPVNGNGKKLPVVSPAARERFSNALKQVFSIDRDDEDASTPDVNRNELLKKRLADFPELIIAGLGDEKALKELRDTVLPLHSELPAYKGIDGTKCATLNSALHEKARTLLAAEGIMLPVTEAPTQPEASIPAATAAAIESKPIPEPAPVPPSAQTEEGVQTPAVFTSVVATESGHGFAKVEKPEIQPRPPRPVLTDEEQLALWYKREDALAETLEHLRGDARMYVAQAQNHGFDQFECRIDLKKPGFPILMLFSKEVGEEGSREIERQSSPPTLKYTKAYSDRGLSMTMKDALLLENAITGYVLAQDGIVSATQSGKSRENGLKDLDRYLPSPIMGTPRIIERSGGTYSLELKGSNPSSRRMEMTDISIPLGLAVHDRESPEEKTELKERKECLLGLIHDVERANGPNKSKCFIRKRELLGAYKEWLAEEGKQWVSSERFVLPPQSMEPGQFETLQGDEKKEAMKLQGFHKSNLLTASSITDQKISLAPVILRMDVGGDNPSWHADLNFHLGDKHSPALGDRVRSCSLNLHTSDPELAIARTWESLTGVRSPKTGEPVLPGLFQQLRNLTVIAGQDWQHENENKSAERVVICRMPQTELDDRIRRHNDSIKAAYPIEGVDEGKRVDNQKQRDGLCFSPILYRAPDKHGIVTVTLQDLLDDMTRYEKDVGVEKVAQSQPDAQGNIHIRLQATRSRLRDHGGTVTPKPEYVYDNDGGARKPIAFTIPVPASHAAEIASFVEAIDTDKNRGEDEKRSVGHLLEMEASSIHIPKRGEQGELRRKKPRDYRTSQIRDAICQGVGTLYNSEDFFHGHALPKNWNEPEVQAGYVSDGDKEKKAHHRSFRPNLDGEERFVRRLHRPSDPSRSLI